MPIVIDAPQDGTDATQIILDQIAAAPDGSTIHFPNGARYRCDRTLYLEGRHDLTIEAPGPTAVDPDPAPAVFWTDLKVNSTDHPWAFVQNPAVPTSYGKNSQRQHWRLSNCTDMVLRNLRVEGPNTYRNAKGYTMIQAPWEAEHAFALPGSDGVLIEDCSADSPLGDGVFLGAGGTHASGPKNVIVRHFDVKSPGRTGVGITRCSEILLDDVTVSLTGTGALSMEPNGPKEYVHHVEVRNCHLDAWGPLIPARGIQPITDIWVHHNTFVSSGNAISWPIISCRPLSTDPAVRSHDWRVEDNVLLYAGTGGAFNFAETDNVTVSRNSMPLLGKFRAGVVLDNCLGINEIHDNNFGNCLGLYEATNGTSTPTHSGNVWAGGAQHD